MSEMRKNNYLLADTPISFEDLIKVESQNLANFIGIVYKLLNTYQDGNVTLCVKGEWGTGKTTFLKGLENFFERCGHFTVFFESWKFKEDDDYILSLIKELRGLPGLKSQFKGNLTRIMRTLITDLVLPTGLNFLALNFLKNFQGENEIIPEISDFSEIINKLIEKKSRSLEVREKLKKIVAEILEKNNSNSNSFDNSLPPELNEVKELFTNTESKFLFLFIDDLDRLLPEDAFHMIESLRLYFDIKNVVIIMGINEEVIEYYIFRKIYGDINDEKLQEKRNEYFESYLEKIFHYSYRLSKTNVNDIHLSIFEKFKLKNEIKEIIVATELNLSHRKWVRILNKLFILLDDLYQKELFVQDNIKLFLPSLVIKVILEQLFPDFEILFKTYPFLGLNELFISNTKNLQLIKEKLDEFEERNGKFYSDVVKKLIFALEKTQLTFNLNYLQKSEIEML